MTELNLLVGLLEQTCVFLIVLYIMSRFSFFNGIIMGKFNLTNRIIPAVVFGALAIYGTYVGIKTTGAIVNIRDMGPIMAGLLGGPWVGLGAGLIGGIHRYFQGGLTAVPCALGTVISGVAAGFLYLKFKEKIGIWKPTLYTFVMLVVDMVLILLIARPFGDAVKVVSIISMPMIIGCTIGMALFSVMMIGLRREVKGQNTEARTTQ